MSRWDFSANSERAKTKRKSSLLLAVLEYRRLKPKTIGNRKRDCAWGCARGINTTRENLQIEKHKSVWWAERTPSWLVLFDLQIFSVGVFPPSATSRTISFSISNNSFFSMRRRTVQPEIRSFVSINSVLRSPAIWQKRRRMRTVSKGATYLATESVNFAPFKRGVRERGANFWHGKVQNSSPILRCTFWQGKVQNSSPISALLRWCHFRLSLSLSLCIFSFLVLLNLRDFPGRTWEVLIEGISAMGLCEHDKN